MLKAFPLASRVYGWYWCCAGLGCVIPCVAEERPLLNSVAIYTIRNSCKSQLLISSVVLYFVPTASKEKKKSEGFQWSRPPKFLPVFYLHLLPLGFIVVRNSLLHSFSVMCPAILATLYLPLCYNQNTSSPSGSNQLLSVCESNQKTCSHNITIMGRFKQCK